MTALSKRKSKLVIETSDQVRERGKYREVVIEATPYVAHVRLKGMRQTFEISWASVYSLAVKQQVEQTRKDKKLKRRQPRGNS